MFEVWNNNNNVWNFAHNSKTHIFTFTVHSTDYYYIFQKLLSNSKIFSDQWIIVYVSIGMYFHLFSQNVLFIFVKKKKSLFKLTEIYYISFIYTGVIAWKISSYILVIFCLWILVTDWLPKIRFLGTQNQPKKVVYGKLKKTYFLLFGPPNLWHIWWFFKISQHHW